MDDLDALLADLQNTTAHLNNTERDTSGYGSLNTSRAYQTEYSPNAVTQVKTERFEYTTPNNDSPIYQNQRIIREVTVTSKTPQSAPNNMSSLNNNLSELDTLLEDLNSARYADYPDKKEPLPSSVNGPPVQDVTITQQRRIISSPTSGGGGIHDVRPTVESLLDELQSAVPLSSSPPSYSVHSSYNKTPEQTRITTITYTATSPQAVTSTPAPTASSATKELDDLMASLSDFKINTTQLQSQSPPPPPVISDSPYAKPNKPPPTAPSSGPPPNQLDSMLGTLQSDMSRQGINTTQKGCCGACGKPIVGQVVTALAKTWHPEHFTCAHCNQELGTKNFFERDGRPYCENDYHNLFSPRCAYCNGPILDKCVTALDKTWHPEHFFCAQCGNPFGEDGFHEKDGKPYCRDDYFDMFAPKCGGCSRPIMENYISALNTQWHPDCFVCRECKQGLQGGSFYVVEGKPQCAKCCGVGEDDSEEEEEEA